MATPPLPPQPVVYRGQPRVASQVQDSTLATYKATQNVLSSNASSIAALQSTTAQGTIGNGVAVTVSNSAASATATVTHNLGYIARGYVVIHQTAIFGTCRLAADPVPSNPQPTQANKTPTSTMQISRGADGQGTQSYIVWVF